MTTTPIFLKDISFIHPNKTCFEDFNTVIYPGDRIGISGRNGSGKSTLLRMIQGQIEPTSGHVQIESGITIGYVPQIVEDFDTYYELFNVSPRQISQSLSYCLDYEISIHRSHERDASSYPRDHDTSLRSAWSQDYQRSPLK